MVAAAFLDEVSKSPVRLDFISLKKTSSKDYYNNGIEPYKMSLKDRLRKKKRYSDFVLLNEKDTKEDRYRKRFNEYMDKLALEDSEI